MGRKVAYLDLDAVAYTGASIAQKLAYKWKKKDGSEETEVFDKAAKAKEWYDGEVGFGLIEPEEWERETITLFQPLDIAIKGVDYELKKWKDSVTKLWEEDCKFVGFLTCSGLKNKDAKGLEDRYQFNRYTDRVNWVPKEKPVHLPDCRSYLSNTYDWIQMSPNGVEADAIVVGFAERRGLDACIGFKDKDLRQTMGVNLIEMNAQPRDRVLETTGTLGDLRVKKSVKSVKSVDGEGFKLLCYQTCVGDSADGYKGIKGFGPMAGYDLLKECTTVDECCKALVELYQGKFSEGKQYKSWDKQKIDLSWKELLTQHMGLAYHERSSKDLLTPIERYLIGDNPLYQH